MNSGLRKEKYSKNLLSRYIYRGISISSDAYNSCVEDVLRGTWGGLAEVRNRLAVAAVWCRLRLASSFWKAGVCSPESQIRGWPCLSLQFLLEMFALCALLQPLES